MLEMASAENGELRQELRELKAELGIVPDNLAARSKRVLERSNSQPPALSPSTRFDSGNAGGKQSPSRSRAGSLPPVPVGSRSSDGTGRGGSNERPVRSQPTPGSGSLPPLAPQGRYGVQKAKITTFADLNR